MEFKGGKIGINYVDALVDIGTEWNLKVLLFSVVGGVMRVDIGTEWNLKIPKINMPKSA